ncbi:MAG: NAD-dependent protein deacylase [Peptostreptococcaceae bacterium]|nr:NAD-dependent protein deacylase [Peptostreptococcaceae bacterium]
MSDIERLQQMVDESKSIVFFGGAGVSTESGIPDFRSVDGLYNLKYKFPPETILSHSFFMSQPSDFFEFYRDKIIVREAKPNKAHFKLAELEKQGKLSAVITQNIDGLHQMAGSKNVIELHGSIQRNYCMRCKKSYDLDFVDTAKDIPHCECGGTVKPDVVLYEEGLDTETIHSAVYHIQHADLLIIGGTSLAVYPAAGLIDYFKGKYIVLINRDATPRDYIADLIIREKIGEVLGQIH